MTTLVPITERRPVWLRQARRISNKTAFTEADRRGPKVSELVHDSRLCSEMGMQLAASVPVDEVALAHWLKTARPGERLVYHVGHLGFDRSPTSHLPRARRESLIRVADRALALAESGCLVLAQQRVAEGCIAYLAIMPGCRRAQCLSELRP